MSDEKSRKETMFGKKLTIHSCEHFKTKRDTCCTFCMCNVHRGKKNNSDTRKSRRFIRMREEQSCHVCKLESFIVIPYRIYFHLDQSNKHEHSVNPCSAV